MKKLNKFVLKSLALLFVFSIAVSCGESKSNQKVLFDKIVSKAGKTVSEIDKTASEIDKVVSEANQSSSKTSGTSVAEGNYDGLEIPVYTRGTLSETIRKRYSYTVSYNHEMKNPNWVAWTISAEHASGKVQVWLFRMMKICLVQRAICLIIIIAGMIEVTCVLLLIINGVRKLWKIVS